VACAFRQRLTDGVRTREPPEIAAVTRALGVRLGGLNIYRGVPSKKNYLGEPVRPLSRRTFRSVRILLYGASILMVAITCAVLA
jgi:adenosylcobinamide-phosphate synthase